MHNIIKIYQDDFYAKWIAISGLVLNFGLFLFLFFFIEKNDLPIVLHYNVNQGVDYFGEFGKVFVLPGIGLLIILVNNFLFLKILSKSKISAYFLLISAAAVQFFLFMSGVALYLINR